MLHISALYIDVATVSCCCCSASYYCGLVLQDCFNSALFSKQHPAWAHGYKCSSDCPGTSCLCARASADCLILWPVAISVVAQCCASIFINYKPFLSVFHRRPIHRLLSLQKKPDIFIGASQICQTGDDVLHVDMRQ